MLTLDIEHFNPVSLYALYLPHGLVKRLRYFIYGTTPLNIILQANRKEENAWLIKRHYGEIDIIVDNPDDDSVSKLIVFRRNIGASDQLIKEIPFSDFQNNSYSFIDKFLDTDMTYTYRVEALDSTGKVIGVSNEENI
jgi:hypothetical protein